MKEENETPGCLVLVNFLGAVFGLIALGVLLNRGEKWASEIDAKVKTLEKRIEQLESGK